MSLYVCIYVYLDTRNIEFFYYLKHVLQIDDLIIIGLLSYICSIETAKKYISSINIIFTYLISR